MSVESLEGNDLVQYVCGQVEALLKSAKMSSDDVAACVTFVRQRLPVSLDGADEADVHASPRAQPHVQPGHKQARARAPLVRRKLRARPSSPAPTPQSLGAGVIGGTGGVCGASDAPIAEDDVMDMYLSSADLSLALPLGGGSGAVSASPKASSAASPSGSATPTLRKKSHGSDAIGVIVKRMIDGEKKYVARLTSLMMAYYIPLQAKLQEKSFKRHCSWKAFQTLFTNVLQLYHMHEELLSELQEHATRAEVTGSWRPGHLCSSFVHAFGEYEYFMIHLSKSRAKLHELKANATVNAFLEHCCVQDPTGLGIDLGSLLTAPINRIPQLQVDLADLVEATHKSSDTLDLQPLRDVCQAFAALKEVLAMERATRVLSEIQGRIPDCCGLVEPYRFLRHEGDLTVKFEESPSSEAQKDSKEHRVWAFNDVLLLARKASKGLRFVRLLPFRDAVVHVQNAQTWTLRVTIKGPSDMSRTEVATFTAANDADAKEWCVVMSSCISKLEQVCEFGVDVDDLCNRCRPRVDIPPILVLFTTYIRDYAMDTEGVFRISGALEHVERYQGILDRGGRFPLSKNDEHVMCTLLKQWLRLLPKPLIPEDHYDAWIASLRRTQRADTCESDAVEYNAAVYSRLLSKLPTTNRCVLSHIALLCNDLCAHTSRTKMNATNLGTVFGPNVLRRECTDLAMLTKELISAPNDVMARLFTCAHLACDVSLGATYVANQSQQESTSTTSTTAAGTVATTSSPSTPTSSSTSSSSPPRPRRGTLVTSSTRVIDSTLVDIAPITGAMHGQSKCHGCGFALGGSGGVRVGPVGLFHAECAACSWCGERLNTWCVLPRKGSNQMCCLADHVRYFKPRCSQCFRSIEGDDDHVRAFGKSWHPSCFNCMKCSKKLSTEERLTELFGLPACWKCGKTKRGRELRRRGSSRGSVIGQ